MTRTLIAGCGDVGTALGRLLAAQGHVVYGLRRNAAALPPEILPISADLIRDPLADILPKGIQRVVYAVAAARTEERAYHDAYIVGLRRLKDALSKDPLPERRLVFASSTGVYGQERGELVDEESLTEPNGFTGRIMLDAEKLATEAFENSTILRFGGIYGPGRTRLIDLVRSGQGLRDESPPVYTNRIHRDDAARALAHVLQGDAKHPIYVAVDEHPAPRAEVHRWIASQLGVTQFALTASPVRGNKRCSNARLRASGFEFLYPTYREGYAALLAP